MGRVELGARPPASETQNHLQNLRGAALPVAEASEFISFRRKRAGAGAAQWRAPPTCPPRAGEQRVGWARQREREACGAGEQRLLGRSEASDGLAHLEERNTRRFLGRCSKDSSDGYFKQEETKLEL